MTTGVAEAGSTKTASAGADMAVLAHGCAAAQDGAHVDHGAFADDGADVDDGTHHDDGAFADLDLFADHGARFDAGADVPDVKERNAGVAAVVFDDDVGEGGGVGRDHGFKVGPVAEDDETEALAEDLGAAGREVDGLPEVHVDLDGGLLGSGGNVVDDFLGVHLSSGFRWC